MPTVIFTITALSLVLGAVSECVPADDESCLVTASEKGSMLMQIDLRAQLKVTSQADPALKTGTFAQIAARVAPTGFCTGHPCKVALAQAGPEKTGIGKTAALSQAGYEKVAALKDDTEMVDFILRVADKYDCKVENMGGMMGIVPWFSGTTMMQTLDKLEDTLLYAVLPSKSPSWLSYKNSAGINGDKAELGFVGYAQIAAMKSDDQMTKFGRRVCEDMGVRIIDDGGFVGMVKFYSGTENFQSFERLQAEVRSAANAPHTWAEWKKAPQGKKAVSLSQTSESHREGFALLAARSQSKPAKKSPIQDRAPSKPGGKPAKNSANKEQSGLGSRASLDQSGYMQVVELKDDAEMTQFILRAIDKYDFKVENMGGVNGIVPWFSGSTNVQNINQLEDTLLFAVLSNSKTPWLSYKNSEGMTGDNANLGSIGYVQVAAMRSDGEMKKFVRRMCKDMKVKVVDEGGFEGMVKFYSGTNNFQSYEKLQEELKSAANSPHTWAETMDGKPRK